MIKVYRYNSERNTVSHILQDKNGVSVRYNFEHGNIITKRKPELVLTNKYAQDLLEKSDLFKGKIVTLIRSERTPEDDIVEKPEPTPEPGDSNVIEDVTNDTELLAFVNKAAERTKRNAFLTPINALKWAQDNDYSFPNYNPKG